MRYPHRALPSQTPHNYHLRPSVKRGISDNPPAHSAGEQPCENLEHDDLLELFRHDEEQGLITILLVQGTEIQIPIDDEQGVKFWVSGVVSSPHQRGSLNFKAEFPGSTFDRVFGDRHGAELTWISFGVSLLNFGKGYRQST